MNRSTKRSFLIVLLAVWAFLPLFAAGSPEVPAAEVSTSGTQYISPNGDGIQENGVIAFKVTIYVKSKEGYIPEYGMRVVSAEGTVVREVVEREKPDLGWFMRLFSRYQSFTLEKSLEWDGTDKDGSVVPDGEYALSMWVVDEKKQTTELALDSFVVDVTAPSVELTIQSPPVFSPNDDGNIDTYEITQQNGSVEDTWKAGISDGSVTVRNYTWTSSAPATFVWDGTDDSGTLVPDGTYHYWIESQDRAGNRFSTESEGFALLTVETPLTLALDQDFISPNDDGVQDELVVTLGRGVAEGVVQWSVVVDDGEGTVVRHYGGDGAPPEQVVFDGRDDENKGVQSGSYRVLYSLHYYHGNEPFLTGQFVVDLTPPAIDVTVSKHVISPNGDGRNEETRISFKSSEIVTWQGAISNASGNVIGSTDSTHTTSLIVWGGMDREGNLVPDGTYSLHAEFTDRAGNITEIPTEEIAADVTAPVVTFALDQDYFSPDGDGIKDTLTADFSSNEPVRGLLSLSDSSGRDAGTLGGFGQAYHFIEGSFRYVWGGISGTGLYLPDGTYTVSSEYEDRAGNRVSLPDKSFTIDTRTVQVAVSAPTGFSPNDDGKDDTITIAVAANFYDAVEAWKLDFVDGFGKVLQTVAGEGRLPREFTWDGSMQYADSRIKTPEGLYHGNLSVTYRKGDSVAAATGAFFVDVTPPAINLQATADPFIQAGESIEGDLFVTLHIDDAHEIVDWSMDLLTPNDEIVRSFSGTGDLQDQIVWKNSVGKPSDGSRTEQVTIRIRVIDEVGNATIFEQKVPVDIIVVNRGGKLYLMVPNVIFGAYQHELDSRGAEQLQKNLESIDRVVDIFNKYPTYRLLLEGHALNVFYGGSDNEKREKEEKVLVPLTERRAKTVEAALIDRGLSADRIETRWYGGTQPIVDVHDRAIRWKNRRVEFIMLRPGESVE